MFPSKAEHQQWRNNCTTWDGKSVKSWNPVAVHHNPCEEVCVHTFQVIKTEPSFGELIVETRNHRIYQLMARSNIRRPIRSIETFQVLPSMRAAEAPGFSI